jgi:hypothetical protein
MDPLVGGRVDALEIIDPVVVSDPVDVMHLMPGRDRPALAFPHEHMREDSAL